MKRIFHFINDQQIPMFVKLVLKGEQYGHNNCLTHGRDDPLVEFYSTKFQVDGYFISRYSLSMLRGENPICRGNIRNKGICLQGDMREYDIDQCAAEMVMRWLDLEVPPTNTKS
jgi:hypothetical protein